MTNPRDAGPHPFTYTNPSTPGASSEELTEQALREQVARRIFRAASTFGPIEIQQPTMEQMQAAMKKAQADNLFNQLDAGLRIHESKFLQPGTAMMMNPADRIPFMPDPLWPAWAEKKQEEAARKNKLVPPPIETYEPLCKEGEKLVPWISFAFGVFKRFLKEAFHRLRCELYCGHWDCPIHYPLLRLECGECGNRFSEESFIKQPGNTFGIDGLCVDCAEEEWLNSK